MWCSVTSMPKPLQACGDVAPGALAVVGQEEEWDVRFSQFVHEAIRPGDEMSAPVDDSVHVNQISKHHDTSLPISKTVETSKVAKGECLLEPNTCLISRLSKDTDDLREWCTKLQTVTNRRLASGRKTVARA